MDIQSEREDEKRKDEGWKIEDQPSDKASLSLSPSPIPYPHIQISLFPLYPLSFHSFICLSHFIFLLRIWSEETNEWMNEMLEIVLRLFSAFIGRRVLWWVFWLECHSRFWRILRCSRRRIFRMLSRLEGLKSQLNSENCSDNISNSDFFYLVSSLILWRCYFSLILLYRCHAYH